MIQILKIVELNTNIVTAFLDKKTLKFKEATF